MGDTSESDSVPWDNFTLQSRTFIEDTMLIWKMSIAVSLGKKLEIYFFQKVGRRVIRVIITSNNIELIIHN